ncbi:hypothetical protein DCCM_3868 [Desulfocucumis palustris]|uniref:Uncharacterized protein n=1 Tax=Desulfocucumis palustris TaxID=1898651 RepID=A0A2L2XES8_9FIRM|nr:hypothetical protein DCCM_3868 [Desulfocucumis palustris]
MIIKTMGKGCKFNPECKKRLIRQHLIFILTIVKKYLNLAL